MNLHRLKGYIQNIFLVEYDHGLLLLDGCSRADVTSVSRFITDQLNRPLADLKLVIVTHMHPDHAGGAHKLRALSGCKILAHPKASKWYAGAIGRLAHVTDVFLTYWVAGRLGRPKKHIWYPARLRPDAFLQDDQALPEFEEWQCLFTPGHTDHDVSLWHAKTGKLYVADLVVKVKGDLVPPFPVCHPNQYRRSLHRVSALQNTQILFAHLPERALRASDFERLIAIAPRAPKNMWRAMRSRIKHRLGVR